MLICPLIVPISIPLNMKNFRFSFFFLWIAFAGFACTPDREIEFPIPVHHDIQVDSAVVVINEFVAKGSLNANEFGTNEDWFEIFNPNPDTFFLQEGKWFASNDAANPTKSPLPFRIIPPHGHLVIWCDEADSISNANDIHVSFKLSSGGEDFGLYYQDSSSVKCIDHRSFGPQNESSISHGRLPDGSQNWIVFNLPTPGHSNQ